jgi:beta-barrel assembly-enhancing protease
MSSFHALFGRQSGTATISKAQIDFVSDDKQQTFSIPLGSLQIQAEGHNSVHFYLSHKAYPGKEICLQDLKAIELLSSFGIAAAASTLKVASKTNTIKAVTWSSPIVIGLAALFLIPLFLSFIPVSLINNMVSVEQEKYLGDLIWPKVLLKEEVKEDAKERIALQKILDALIASNPELSQFKVEVHVSDDSEVNAFALPGGRIIVNRGLIKKATPEEILGVMAHELAHIERRHILKSVSGSLGSLAGYIIIASIVGTDAAGVLLSVKNFTSLTYSRADEAEADRRGLEFIQNAGFSGQGMVSFFEKLAAESGEIEKSLTFMSTHPASEDRAATLKELIKQKKSDKELPVTIQDFSP